MKVRSLGLFSHAVRPRSRRLDRLTARWRWICLFHIAARWQPESHTTFTLYHSSQFVKERIRVEPPQLVGNVCPKSFGHGLWPILGRVGLGQEPGGGTKNSHDG